MMEKNNFVIDQTLFDLKLNEAQFYSDQGLYDEADKIYANLINQLKQLPDTRSSAIQIRQLESIRQEYQTETTTDKVAPNSPYKTKMLNEQLEFNQKVECRDENYPDGCYSSDNIDSDIDNQVVAFINDMIIGAFQKDTSDIHIEPAINSNHISTNSIKSGKSRFATQPHEFAESNTTKIRFRIDGICQPYTELPNKFALHVIFKIKLMAKMDITMRAKPLYGKIKFKSDETGTIELQVITIPTIGSKEDVVLKFFPTAKPMDLISIGFLEHTLSLFVEMINKPYGLILVAGLSGSGKTTTLHSALKLINRPEKKIWSVENPVEITQKGIRQAEVQLQKGLGYPELLEAFIKSGSDVIMLGEIVDYETASIAIKAALSGHLIFAGINAENVPDTIRKVLEMGVSPTNFANALLSILSQRLVRRLCEKCRSTLIKCEQSCIKSTQLTDNTLDILIGESDNSDESIDIFNHTEQENTTFYEHSSDGCEHCAHTGYKGRVAIHELLINNDAIKSLIKETTIKENSFVEKIQDGFENTESTFQKIEVAVSTLKKNAAIHGIYSFKQDGLLKMMAGITDMPELKRNFSYDP